MMKLDYTRYYKNWHEDTPEHIGSVTKSFQKTLAPFFPKDIEADILDIGCGMGYCLLALQELGFINITGIDIDEGQIESCQKKKLNVELVVDSIGYLLNSQSKFDFILALDVIEHVPHDCQMKFVSAIYASLKPGGTFVCTVPNANSALACRWRYNDWTHHSSFTEHSLDFLLFNAGFSDIRVVSLDDQTRPPILTLHFCNMTHWKRVYRWFIFSLHRRFQRFQLYAELGDEAWDIPLSLNILGLGKKEL